MLNEIRPLVAGNWKMNGTLAALEEIRAMVDGIGNGQNYNCDALICPPATLIHPMCDVCQNSALNVGAQNCHFLQSGAHTGDISAQMLRDSGASMIIVGHSERRADHSENDDIVNKKACSVYEAGLKAIICIGETQEQRENGQTLDVLSTQLHGSLPKHALSANTIIAYEPVWAIGTGLTPSVEDIRVAHAHIRQVIQDIIGNEGAKMALLYGGSVKPGNAKELLSVENVNGALVGGASLKASDFLGICAAYA